MHCCSTQNIGCPDQLGSCADYGCEGYFPSRPCQCNDKCADHGNCCHDFLDTCSANPGMSKHSSLVKEQAPAKFDKPFDCTAGVSSWETGWTTAKKIDCCVHFKVACTPFACDQGDRQSWHGEKKVYCCVHENIGCGPDAAVSASPPLPTPPPPTLPPGAFPPHPAHGVGAPPPHLAPGGKYDCNADVPVSLWSPPKQAWCCKYRSMGCSDSDARPAIEPFGEANTEDRLPVNSMAKPAMDGRWRDAESQTSTESRLAVKGSPMEKPRAEPFDCDAGFSNWAWGWSHSKQTWCCKHHNKGCGKASEGSGHTETASLNDCSSHSSTWTSEKKHLCCRKFGKGCPMVHDDDDATHTAPSKRPFLKPFNCESGLPSSHDWSVVKKRWCCTYENKGCPDRPDPSAAPYGKALHFSQPASRDATSSAPLDYEHYEKPTSSATFDCNEDYENWKFGWSSAKAQYCCRTAGRGCTGGAHERTEHRNKPMTQVSDVSVKSEASPRRWFLASPGNRAYLALPVAAVAIGAALALMSRWVRRQHQVVRRQPLNDQTHAATETENIE